MNEQIVETVLNEILEDLKQVTQSNRTLQATLQDLSARLDTFAAKLNDLKVIAPPIDPQPLHHIVSEGVQKISAIVEAQPKAVIQHRRFVLFPENDHQGRFNFLIKWIVFLVLGLAALGVLSTWLQSLH